MKIVKIETLRLPEHPCTIWVQAHTSDGLVGLGETYQVPGAVEAVIHDKMHIAIEGRSRWDLNCALRIARALEPCDVLWMEDAIQPQSVDDLVRLAQETHRRVSTISQRGK
jgi:L-alanine-DL-glutamate epimerase-like enolase superfamily enzyme